MPLALLFFLKIFLAILGLLCFYINFRIIHFSSVKNVMCNLIRITLKLYSALGNMAVLTILVLPIQDHGLSFHLFGSSSISSINVLQFSVHKSFTSLTGLSLGIVFFNVILKGFSFLLSLSDILLLV